MGNSMALTGWLRRSARTRDTIRQKAPAAAGASSGSGGARPAAALTPVQRAANPRAPALGGIGKTGVVYLVGAGPGDPELLTVKAARLIGSADVLVYDHLVGKGVLALARADAGMIYVGKEAGNHSLPQPEINDLLVRLARQGLQVVRLKGGDPFIFGRGGEEVEDLVRAGVHFDVVPGITAAAGAGAATGLPLTHRDHARSLVFVTGHLKDDSLDLDWPALARKDQTVVIYMGIGALGQICAKLMAHGLAAEHPVAIVQNATMPSQQLVSGTLATLPDLAQAAGVRPPGLILVGTVVGYAEMFAPLRATNVEHAAGGIK